jgi:hypothetical protein
VTGFDTDSARFERREKRSDVRPPKTPFDQGTPALVDAAHLKNVFGDIAADRGDGHHVLLVGLGSLPPIRAGVHTISLFPDLDGKSRESGPKKLFRPCQRRFFRRTAVTQIDG